MRLPRVSDFAVTRPVHLLKRSDSYALTRGRAIAILVALPLASTMAGARRPVGDLVAFFLPMYVFLGERLRAGDIPGWNPHQLSGAPFVGDPQSGWMYLPAMLFFTMLPPAAAVFAWVLFHVMLAGVSTYFLSRLLGLGIQAALVTGVTYELGWIYERSNISPPFVQVAAWLPMALLGAELAISATITRQRRVSGWAIAGFSISQILAGWVGQGAFYALLALMGYVAYRTLLIPPVHPIRGLARLKNLILHSSAILVFGFSLAAAGLLPRLDANTRTNLAGGEYRGSATRAADLGAWTFQQLVHEVLGGNLDGAWYVGGATLSLAVVGLVTARRWVATPFCAVLGLGSLILSLEHQTPLSSVLFTVLPPFRILQSHHPERITLLFYLPISLLAGAAVEYFSRASGRPVYRAVGALIPAVAVLAVDAFTSWRGTIAAPTQATIVAASVLLSAVALVTVPTARRLIIVALLVTIWWEPTGRALAADWMDHGPRRGELPVSLTTYIDHKGAAAFLADASVEPVRYIGFDPAFLRRRLRGYRQPFEEALPMWLLTNNRATLFDLYDAQGYNPVQILRYDDYVVAMNGEVRNYREVDVSTSGVNSPLLNLLNVRYLVIPAQTSVDRPELSQLVQTHPTVYLDDQVRVLENGEALPRGWVVHEARQVGPGQALALLGAGRVNPRQTALLEVTPPALSGDVSVTDEVKITEYEPDRMQLTFSSSGSGLLVLSEIYDPGWHAYLDGRPVPIYLVDYVLRGISVPEGSHRVALLYEPPLLRVGMIISGCAFASLGIYMAIVSWLRYRSLVGNRATRATSLSVRH